MDESWYRRSNDSPSFYGQTFKRSKLHSNIGPLSDAMVHLESRASDASTSQKSCFELGQSGSASETPLLEQYRSVLSDVNGRVFQKERGVSRDCAQRKENKKPHLQPVSYSQSSHTLFNVKPSQQHTEHQMGNDAEASSSQDSDVKVLLAQLPSSHVSLDWQDSQVNLPQSESCYFAEPNAGLGDKGGCTSSGTDEEDDADLFYDWRAAAGVSSQAASTLQNAHAESRATTDRPIGQNIEATQCSRADAGLENNLFVPSVGGQCLNQNKSLLSWQDAERDLAQQRTCLDDDLESDSQEGALSQLLEMVDEDVLKPNREADCISPNTEPEFLSTSQVDSAPSEEPALEQQATSGQKARPLSKEERSRFILEASQAVLADSEEQSGGEESEGEDDEDTMECPVCGVSLQQMEAASRDAHTNRCLDGADEEVRG